jgi:hypothetical protein
LAAAAAAKSALDDVAGYISQALPEETRVRRAPGAARRGRGPVTQARAVAGLAGGAVVIVTDLNGGS